MSLKTYKIRYLIISSYHYHWIIYRLQVPQCLLRYILKSFCSGALFAIRLGVVVTILLLAQMVTLVEAG